MSKLQYFCVGAVASTVSWFVLLFLYANIESIEIKARRLPPQSDNNHVKSIQHIFNLNEPVRGKDSNKASQLSVKKELPYNEAEELKQKNDLRNSKANNHNDEQWRVKKGSSMVGQFVPGTFTSAVDAGRIKTDEDQEEHDRGVKRHVFNEFLSSRLSVYRDIPDTRITRCREQENDKDLAAVSIIICFYNEAPSTLMRSVHSIVARTDSKLIKEILLIDDFSDAELVASLSDYVEQHFGSLVKIVSNIKREGLIRARMRGARLATAKVLVFLDSHIEVNQNWLPPLLQRIKKNVKVVVVPVIDIIDPDSFEYRASPMVRGGFTWSLHFSWEPLLIDELVGSNSSLYITSPAMAGGLFAMDKNSFFSFGGYDEGMDIWGGENIEMSLRIWMCGGRIEIAICSRVGHIFRSRRPYSSPNHENTLLKNTLRTVDVWLDHYKDRFYKNHDDRYTSVDFGDTSDRAALRRDLDCHDFNWFITYVYNPDSKHTQQSVVKSQPKEILDTKRVETVKDVKAGVDILRKGRFIHLASGLCIQPTSVDNIQPFSPLVLGDCFSQHPKWYQTKENTFLLGSRLCLDVLERKATVTKCTGNGGTQKWTVQTVKEVSLVYNPGTGLCLSVQKPAVAGAAVMLQTCGDAHYITYK